MAKAQQERRLRGRPTLPPDKVKRHALGIRTTKELKDSLQRATESSGRSVAQEIEFRLEQSFALEKEFGGPQTQKLLRALAGLAPDDEWIHSWFSRRAVFSDWQRRIIEDSPSRLALDLMYYSEKYGIDRARELAISYFAPVKAKFSKRDQKEYCQWVEEIVGLSPKELVAH